MLSHKSSLSVYFLALITALLVVTLSAQSSTSVRTRYSCEDRNAYFERYSEIIPGFKVLDALHAQRKYMLRQEIKSQFLPSMPTDAKHATIDRKYVVDAIKSLTDLIILKERYEKLTEGIQNPQLSLVQVLFTKVVEDAYHWLNESANIHIHDCTNIDVSHMEALQSRIVLHDTLKSTYEIVNEVMGNVNSKRSHYCAWINDRILGKCEDQSSINSSYGCRHLSALCNNKSHCNTDLCTLQSM